MMRLGKLVTLVILAAALLGGPTPANGASFDKGDGWYKWSVDGAMAMGSSCCYRLKGDSVSRQTCNLDSKHGTIISNSDCSESSGTLTFYVRSKRGKPAVVRAFDSNCPVSTEEAVTDLGPVSVATSDAMLLEIIQATDLDKDVREDALFWLVQAGSDATFEYLDQLLSANSNR